MLDITKEEILARLVLDNRWWRDFSLVPFMTDPKRAYFTKFYDLVTQTRMRRAVILMGPRRIGKTVMLYQAIAGLIADGIDPKKIFYVSIDAPTYLGLSLEKLTGLFMQHNGLKRDDELYLFFDEIQYLKDWEVHLKAMVDAYPSFRLIASGSAAAALKMKSRESGAGRFTEFMLPPLTFSEFIHFRKKEEELIEHHPTDPREDKARDIDSLNKCFIDYLNYGGYPEIVIDGNARVEMRRYVGQDIIDKVLLRDLPSLYGIRDVQELNRLFAVLSYNTGNEVNLDGLSKSSGVAKETLKKYLEYLEAAFLIVRVRKINKAGEHFEREHYFKVYLTAPSIRAALFTPVGEDDPAMGHMTETAVFSQWFHSPDIALVRYARWQNGEVDIVKLRGDTLRPAWAYEVKWSDHYFEQPGKLSSLIRFAQANKLEQVMVTTKTITGTKAAGRNLTLKFIPASLHCYIVGRRVLAQG